MSVLGTSPAKPDAFAKVTGAARYTGDLTPEGLLHAMVVFTDQPHARITRLDTSAAEAVDGVVAVLTRADVVANEYGLTINDQPVLVGPAAGVGATDVAVAGDVSRWEADHLAVVVAESPEIATAAAALIETEWEPLPLVLTLDEALAEGAPLVHPESDTNTYHHLHSHHGDLDAAFAEADVIVEGTYTVPFQEHAFLETEAALASIDDEGRVTVECGGQWTHEDREQIAHALGLPEEQVRVIYRTIGGAFGGKEDMSLQIVLALAAKVLDGRGIRRPVRCVWSREESIVGHHKRHRGRVHARHGFAADGTLLAAEVDGYLDAGAYNYTSNKVLGNLHLSVAGAYEIPAARVDSYAVYTTNVPGGAFRGFGGPQGAFVAEQQMNKAAAALGIDPVELRRRNTLREGSIGITQVPLPAGVSLPEVIDACAAEAAWDEPLGDPVPIAAFASLSPSTASVRRGRGFASGYKNVGFSFGFPERSEARIILRGGEQADGEAGPDEGPTSAEIFLAGADVGQGAHTAFRQMAAEALGLRFDAIEATFSDTATCGDSGSASASRLSWMTGNAIIGAATEATKAWRDGERPAIGAFRYTPPPTEVLSTDGSPTQPNFTYGYVAQSIDLSVDIETGHIVVHDVVCAIDVGRVIHEANVIGQIEGGVVQAHGYALSENLQVAEGRILNPRLSTYLIPGVGDIPERVRSVVLEVPDPRGPFGVRGMAEMPFIPYAPAISAAVHDATGVWFDEFPLTPARVLAGLKAAGVS